MATRRASSPRLDRPSLRSQPDAMDRIPTSARESSPGDKDNSRRGAMACLQTFVCVDDGLRVQSRHGFSGPGSSGGEQRFDLATVLVFVVREVAQRVQERNPAANVVDAAALPVWRA
jgi:hypothetical protein